MNTPCHPNCRRVHCARWRRHVAAVLADAETGWRAWANEKEHELDELRAALAYAEAQLVRHRPAFTATEPFGHEVAV